MEIIKIIKTPKVDNKEIDISKHPRYIQDFVSTMKGRNLSYFYNNLDTLKIDMIDKKDMELKYAAAGYIPKDNVIKMIKGNLRTNIMHELLHSATRVKNKDRILVGFMQVLPNEYGLGMGLNEGYTALMDDRYFLDYSEEKAKQINTIYPNSKYICTLLEYLLGQEHMENLYMNADLYTLAKELSKYSSPRKTYNFITRFDKYFMETDTKMVCSMKKAINLYDDIILYISECLMTKLRMMYNNKELTEKEYETCLLFVKHIMNTRLEYLKVIKSRKLMKYYDKMLDKVNKKVDKKSRVK